MQGFGPCASPRVWARPSRAAGTRTPRWRAMWPRPCPYPCPCRPCPANQRTGQRSSDAACPRAAGRVAQRGCAHRALGGRTARGTVRCQLYRRGDGNILGRLRQAVRARAAVPAPLTRPQRRRQLVCCPEISPAHQARRLLILPAKRTGEREHRRCCARGTSLQMQSSGGEGGALATSSKWQRQRQRQQREGGAPVRLGRPPRRLQVAARAPRRAPGVLRRDAHRPAQAKHTHTCACSANASASAWPRASRQRCTRPARAHAHAQAHHALSCCGCACCLRPCSRVPPLAPGSALVCSRSYDATVAFLLACFAAAACEWCVLSLVLHSAAG